MATDPNEAEETDIIRRPARPQRTEAPTATLDTPITPAKELTLDEMMASPDAQPDTLFTVIMTAGYGKMPFSHHHQVDGVTFTGCMARNVAEKTIKEWLKSGKLTKKQFKLFPNDILDGEIAKAAGITITTPSKAAASVMATDIDDLYRELGPEKARALAEQLLARAPKKRNG